MLVSHCEMFKGPQCITQAQVDRGSNRLVLACESGGLIEIVLHVFHLAHNRERPRMACAKFGLKAKTSPVRQIGSSGVGQCVRKKLVSSTWFHVLPKKQVAQGIARERRTGKAFIKPIEMTPGLIEIARSECRASGGKVEVIAWILHIGLVQLRLGGDRVS